MQGPGGAAGSGCCKLPTAGEGRAAARSAVSRPGPRGRLALGWRNFPRFRAAEAGPLEGAAGAPCCPTPQRHGRPAPQIPSFSSPTPPSVPRPLTPAAQPAEGFTRPALRRAEDARFHPLSCSSLLLQEPKSWLPRAPVTNGSPWPQSRAGSILDAPRISPCGQTSRKEAGEEKKEEAERRGPARAAVVMGISAGQEPELSSL